jgi:hypothetical protein
LEGILYLGRSARQHLPRVRQQARTVAVMNDAEGLLVTLAEERDELLVRAQTEQWSAKRDPGASQAPAGLDCGSFHE